MSPSSNPKSQSAQAPVVANWLQNGFHTFLRPYLKRHFHAIAIDRTTRPDQSILASEANREQPVIVYGNHPSWWDPLIGHFLNRQLFSQRQFYAPIDAEALEQYRVFAKLGFYGVQLNHGSGAAAFLKQSNAILNKPKSAIWITPEGRFCDARDDQAMLMPGLAHLCHRAQTGFAIAMALEYVFWDERLPVCLARFSSPISLAEPTDWTKADWHANLTNQLRQNQQALAKIAIARDSSPLDNLLEGTRGAGVVYDSFRRGKAWITGTEFRRQHGKQFD